MLEELDVGFFSYVELPGRHRWDCAHLLRFGQGIHPEPRFHEFVIR
jgi:hypothetical protein